MSSNYGVSYCVTLSQLNFDALTEGRKHLREYDLLVPNRRVGVLLDAGAALKRRKTWAQMQCKCSVLCGTYTHRAVQIRGPRVLQIICKLLQLDNSIRILNGHSIWHHIRNLSRSRTLRVHGRWTWWWCDESFHHEFSNSQAGKAELLLVALQYICSFTIMLAKPILQI